MDQITVAVTRQSGSRSLPEAIDVTATAPPLPRHLAPPLAEPPRPHRLITSSKILLSRSEVVVTVTVAVAVAVCHYRKSAQNLTELDGYNEGQN